MLRKNFLVLNNWIITFFFISLVVNYITSFSKCDHFGFRGGCMPEVWEFPSIAILIWNTTIKIKLQENPSYKNREKRDHSTHLLILWVLAAVEPYFCTLLMIRWETFLHQALGKKNALWNSLCFWTTVSILFSELRSLLRSLFFL